MLFTDRSLWTMVHGILLGGAPLMALSAALFLLYATRLSDPATVAARTESRAFAGLALFTAATLWLTILIGTYIVFPPYRAAPPAGAADLAMYPRSMILANPGTAWLHSFAMESKEHVPWIAAMLVSAVAFVAVRYRSAALNDTQLRRTTAVLLSIAFGLVAFVALMGILVNKVAPLQ
jgi:hypothetical protein